MARKTTVKPLTRNPVKVKVVSTSDAIRGAIFRARSESARILAAITERATDVAAEVRKIETKFKVIAMQKANDAKTLAKSTAGDTVKSLVGLEQAFEKRVGRTFNNFGIPSAAQVRELSARMKDLQADLKQLKRVRA